ncbi:hypothetical protein [Paraburkholderia megapolitana]|uniref:Uncharacterized protein n=1 Tax=Paraburkholderia megapolitana TaxID=420953 RepID=A0A1I3DW34_9BURK|nr:hypothetical protein [Paraburkholderia megapolitana]QDQ79790.1 hypothetical protein FNZ07_00620 [Paraburkholderia megapolitana]SFH90798.1 hypothetical protein SAMN05192543_101548 [Paraburkholderia megapolitana]
MTGLSIQNNYAVNPFGSVNGGSSGGGLNTQQIEQIIEELLAACQSLLPGSDSDGISPTQGAGSSSAPSNFNTSPANSIDPSSGNSPAGGLNMQQIEQIIQELIAAFQNVLPGSDDNSMSSPQGGGGGGGGGSPSFNAMPQPQPGGAPGGAPSGGNNAPPPASNPPGGSPGGSPSGSSNPPPPASNPPVGSSSSAASGVTNNAGGVPQAGAVDGVSPASTQTMNTGTGNDKTFNVTNDTNRTESFTYSVQGANKATMTLAPGQTGTFTAGSGDIGVRISPSDANGNTKPNEVLYEDGGAGSGQAAGAGNPDISKVDGNKDFGGNAENMTVTLSDGRTAGDGDAIHAYQYPTDDAASMGLAGDTSKTANIVMSDAT